ncbi:MAG TPA: DUF2064 domain-containing protein [Rhodospirillales bacterium]|nr:DUF2064 domain-containing protein [Rhodospirillales bacterium]
MGQETSTTTQSVAVAVMCAVPAARTEDTRLSPPLSREEAATLSACFIADKAAMIADLDPRLNVRGFAVIAPVPGEEVTRATLPKGFATLPVRGDDAGTRCNAAVEDLLASGHGAVCLLNAACPTLPAALLHGAVEALGRPGERVVLGPALGGRVTLIGVQRPYPRLFEGLVWNSAQASKLIAARAAAESLPIEQLKPWYTVEDGLGLAWLLRELLGDGRSPLGNGLAGAGAGAVAGAVAGAAAPRTRAYLAALGGRGAGPPEDPGPNVPDPRAGL